MSPSGVCPLNWFRGKLQSQTPVPNRSPLSGSRLSKVSSGIPCLHGVEETLLWLPFSPSDIFETEFFSLQSWVAQSCPWVPDWPLTFRFLYTHTHTPLLECWKYRYESPHRAFCVLKIPFCAGVLPIESVENGTNQMFCSHSYEQLAASFSVNV